MTRSLFLLGGTGFIGKEVVGQALAAGFEVKALGRSDASREQLHQLGAIPISGDADDPSSWSGELRGAGVLIDLLQPPLPKRLSPGNIDAISRQRQDYTAALLESIGSIAEPAERPVLFNISGAEDLQPNASGAIDHTSPLREDPYAFSRIGVPVRRLVEASGVDAAYVYLGGIVYGPGKVFADVIVDGLRKRRAKVIGKGSNHMPLTHVADAAGALVHLAGLPREQLVGKTFLATDGSTTTQREWMNLTAKLMGRKAPGSVPAWLAGLVAGGAAAESITADVRDDPSALLATGFKFRFPSPAEGIPDTLRELGALA